MSIGKSWSKGYRANRYKGAGQKGCPNGRAKCWYCSRPGLVAYKSAAKSPLSDNWDVGHLRMSCPFEQSEPASLLNHLTLGQTCLEQSYEG